MQIGINIANHRDLLSKRYIHDTARLAEDLGFDSVWIPDHAVVPRAVEARYGPVYYDAIAVLSYLAGITDRVWAGLRRNSRHSVPLLPSVDVAPMKHCASCKPCGRRMRRSIVGPIAPL